MEVSRRLETLGWSHRAVSRLTDLSGRVEMSRRRDNLTPEAVTLHSVTPLRARDAVLGFLYLLKERPPPACAGATRTDLASIEAKSGRPPHARARRMKPFILKGLCRGRPPHARARRPFLLPAQTAPGRSFYTAPNRQRARPRAVCKPCMQCPPLAPAVFAHGFFTSRPFLVRSCADRRARARRFRTTGKQPEREPMQAGQGIRPARG